MWHVADQKQRQKMIILVKLTALSGFDKGTRKRCYHESLMRCWPVVYFNITVCLSVCLSLSLSLWYKCLICAASFSNGQSTNEVYDLIRMSLGKHAILFIIVVVSSSTSNNNNKATRCGDSLFLCDHHNLYLYNVDIRCYSDNANNMANQSE